MDEQAQQGEDELQAEQEAEQLDEQEERDDEQDAEAGGSNSTGTSGVYQRGPASLPERPIPEALRPVIRPVGQKYVTFTFFSLLHMIESQWKLIVFLNHLCRSWKVVDPGAHKRLPNGILGLLCGEHFLGLVRYADSRASA